MSPNEYQLLASRTLISKPKRQYTDEELMIVWCATGVAGESGEVMEHVKKGVFHDHGIDKEVLAKELGDLLWYVAGVASVLGLRLEDIMQQNIDKLKARYPDGFSPEDSINRKV